MASVLRAPPPVTESVANVDHVIGAARGDATLVINASPERLYELITDITRMGDWSPESRGGRWLDGVVGPVVGACFQGENRFGPRRWTTTAKVTAAEPAREFAFSVVVNSRVATKWRYRFEPHPAGTEVTESFEYLWAPMPYAIGNVVLRRGRQLQKGMQTTLKRLKEAAESH